MKEIKESDWYYDLYLKKCFNVEIWNILKNIKEYIKDYSYNRLSALHWTKDWKEEIWKLTFEEGIHKANFNLLISLDHHNSLLKSTLGPIIGRDYHGCVSGVSFYHKY
jgi:hypothetical protein